MQRLRTVRCGTVVPRYFGGYKTALRRLTLLFHSLYTQVTARREVVEQISIDSLYCCDAGKVTREPC
jgi:hypothetical protein